MLTFKWVFSGEGVVLGVEGRLGGSWVGTCATSAFEISYGTCVTVWMTLNDSDMCVVLATTARVAC